MNRLRPFATASPLSVLEMTPEEHRRHVRVEHDRDALRGRLGCTEQASGTVGGLASGLGQVELLGRTADAETEAGLRLVAVVGERADGDVAAVLATAATNAGGGRDRGLDRDVGVVRVVDSNSRIDADRQSLELLRQLDLAIGGVGGELVVPQFLRDHVDAVGLGKAGPLVAGAELEVVASVGQHRRRSPTDRACPRRRSRCDRRG